MTSTSSDDADRKAIGRITFDEEIGWAGSTTGEFHYEQDSFAVIDFSYDQRQEIGDYVATVPHDKLSPAHEKLIASRYKERAFTGGVPPETKFFHFREGPEPRLYAFVQHDVPEEVQPAIEAFRELIEWMRQYPNRAIRGSAQLQKRELAAGDPLELTLRLESVGNQAVVFGNPFTGPKGTGRLKLAVATEKYLLSEFELGREQRVVTENHAEGDTIRLEPREAWQASMKKSLYLTPGRYSLRLVYQSYLQYAYGKEPLEGELPMDLGEIVVR